MDLWEANSISTAYTPHPCSKLGLVACEGTDCGDGDARYESICDKDGCDFNVSAPRLLATTAGTNNMQSYRQGVKDFYGPGMTLDTNKKMTVVTQFIGSGSSLSEIKRFYVQGGKVFSNTESAFAGTEGNSITDAWCEKTKTVFGDRNGFKDRGGLAQMAASLAKGHVLVMSLWDDHAVNMLWLDSSYPTDADPEKPGIARGTCSTDSGKPEDVEANSPGATVIYSNIKFGPIGSTFAQPK